jgi:adenylate cyclase class 2
MNEVEVKFLEIDKANLIRKLESMGARKEFDGTIEPIFFDYPDMRLRKIHNTLRLRKKGGIYELTFKEKRKEPPAKIAKETEVTVSDFQEMKNILLQLGLIELRACPKHRISYTLGDCHYELDTYDGIPTFLEVESEDLESVKKGVERIGFSMKDATPWSVREIMEHYGKEYFEQNRT